MYHSVSRIGSTQFHVVRVERQSQAGLATGKEAIRSLSSHSPKGGGQVHRWAKPCTVIPPRVGPEAAIKKSVPGNHVL